LIDQIFPPALPLWMASGGNNFEVVLSSEAFYVRNLRDRPFPDTLSKEDLRTTSRQLVETLGDIIPDYRFFETEKFDKQDIDYLLERQSIDETIDNRKTGTGLFIQDDESSWITINTSDNLRFRFASAGSDVETVYRKARSFVEELEKNLPFAYSDRFGFLTSHPTECGTGLFIRFNVHIPGLIFSDNKSALRDSLLKSGSMIKPQFNQSVSTDGHVYIVQTSHTLGVDEETILEQAEDVISGIVEMEFQARDELMEKAKIQIEDKIMRGIGIIANARMIVEAEGYALANALRLGASEGLTSETLDLLSATELHQLGKPAHIVACGSPNIKIDMDISRAELFRNTLKFEG